MPKKTFSIDKMIDERDESFQFDEMTAQLAEKIVTELPDEQDDDVESSNYEDLKDMIRDHLVEWYEGGDPTMNKEKQDYRTDLARKIARLASEKSGQDLEDAVFELLPEPDDSFDDDEHK